MKREKVFIIAEAGVNHNGDLGTALAMVETAALSGVDAIKFQTFRAEALATGSAPKAEYQKRTTVSDESQLSMLKRLELDESAHQRLIEKCREQGILFLSSPFDLASVDLLERLGVEIFKIPSGEITNLPLLQYVGRLGKPIILSTGMASLGEIESALEVLCAAGLARDAITLLHCTTEYPAPVNEVNLRAMQTLAAAFLCCVGYSDHTPGWEVSTAAVALGALVIEKHFTLDRKMNGPDHGASLEPDELNAMVKSIRNIEQALGDGLKRPTDAELRNRVVARKSIFAAVPIRKGEIIAERHICMKRPATGISPMDMGLVLGRPASRDFVPDELITL